MIDDGNLVLIRQQTTAEPGAIFVAYVVGDATVKRLARLPDYWVLKPESTQPHYRPILVGTGFSIQGVVTKVIKKGAQFWTAQEMSMSKKSIHVTHRSGRWAVKGAGDSEASSPHKTQAAAIRAATPLAKANHSELVIHGRENEIVDKDSFGNDPRSRKDRKH